MPGAVAGATLMARELLGEETVEEDTENIKENGASSGAPHVTW
jgi:CysZ protein